MITFGSLCSGIEAASIAFCPLGWSPAFYSEIEAFPIAVLKHRHAAQDLRYRRPARVAGNSNDARAERATGGGVPLWGDMAALRVRHLKRFGVAMPDVLVAGTPCQGFSLAGLRGSLSDSRSNLALTFVRIAHAIDNVRQREGKRGLVVLWENVPGVLSTDDNAFGCFLAGLVGADDALRSPFERGRWPHAGMVAGPRARAAWRILDAQYFGLAQRRERVFVVVGFRDAIDPAAVLFERLGMRGNPAPRREARKDVAPTIAARASGGGGLGTDFDCDGGLITREISHCLNGGGMGRQDYETETLIAHSLRAQAHAAHDDTRDTLICADIAGTMTANGNDTGGGNRFPGMNAEGAASGYLVAHALSAEGFDASEDGTGRGTPMVPVAFTSKDYGADAQLDISPTLRAMGHKDSHPNAGGQIAIAIQAGALRENPDSGPDGAGFSHELGHTLEARAEVQAVAYNITPSNSNKDYKAREARYAQSLTTGCSASSSRGGDVIVQSAVRRLTPRECERLQGFEDDYTLIPTAKRNWSREIGDMRDYFHSAYPNATDDELVRLAADGPRYEALGNSKATKVVRWIGERLDAELRKAAA